MNDARVREVAAQVYGESWMKSADFQHAAS